MFQRSLIQRLIFLAGVVIFSAQWAVPALHSCPEMQGLSPSAPTARAVPAGRAEVPLCHQPAGMAPSGGEEPAHQHQFCPVCRGFLGLASPAAPPARPLSLHFGVQVRVFALLWTSGAPRPASIEIRSARGPPLS